MEIPTFLRYVFLLHFIACVIFGIVFYFGPEFYVSATGWPFLDPAAGRVMAALFLGFAVGSLFAYRAASWEEVKIIVLANITWGLLAAVAIVWMMIAHPTIPAVAGWFNVILAAVFFVLFLYSYFKATR